MVALQWLGIIVCLLHSGMFSGLNLGFFGLSRLRLETQAEAKAPGALQILSLRKDAHLLLATILWGNVCSNVLLTLLTNSVLTGATVFFVSTFGITFFGEIIPQAYFAKNALKASHFLVPVVKFYQFILFPIAKPSALLLDLWLGKEKVNYFRESELMIMLTRQAQSGSSDLSLIESLGAVNFMKMDDIAIQDEGSTVNPNSVISLMVENGFPVFPHFTRDHSDPFLQQVYLSGEKWVIITDPQDHPFVVIEADQFLKDVLYGQKTINIHSYCHRPIIITDEGTKLGQVITEFKVKPETPEDDVIDHDLILFWGKSRRIITGADILGRLLRGIAKQV
ncbi:MAG: DUF21 domain-containing protein [Candidatus Omnitrophica bacterium]|nr:DUF21 domain-containing protein [Candidatus Omnitrophota bacterium]